jgi:hypothetical protein
VESILAFLLSTVGIVEIIEVSEAVTKQNTGGNIMGGLPVEIFIIAWPKLVPVLFDVPVILTWTEFTNGFLFLIEKKEILLDREFLGLVITPLDTHLMSAIVGLYFGGSLVKK